MENMKRRALGHRVCLLCNCTMDKHMMHPKCTNRNCAASGVGPIISEEEACAAEGDLLHNRLKKAA